MPREELEAYTSRLFDIWESRVAQEISLEDYALTLEIEEGSVMGSGKLKTTLITLGIAISAYGSFIQGLQTIRSHVTVSGEYLTEKARDLLGTDQVTPTVRNRSGTLGQIQKLFLKVQRREITAEEATIEAEKIIGPEATTAPEFMLRLNASLRDAPLYPQQLSLPMEGDPLEPVHEEPSRNPNSRPSRPKAPLMPANQFRVEIWRESKDGKKKVKVTAL